MIFSSLIIGFTLSFTMLFYKTDKFGDIPMWSAFVKTVSMMTGEYNYDELFNDAMKENYGLKETSKIVFLLFVVLASIVLMNLMVGLAVNDIQVCNISNTDYQ